MRWVGDQFDDSLDGLREADPDFVAPVMDRLGFVRVHGDELRRIRRRRWLGRGTMLVALAGIAAMGVYAHSLGSRARVAGELSIPKAVESSSASAGILGETIRQVGTFLDGPPDLSGEREPLKPSPDPAEQQSKVPWSDLL